MSTITAVPIGGVCDTCECPSSGQVKPLVKKVAAGIKTGLNGKNDNSIDIWFKNFLAGKFDSSGIFERPDDPLPNEQFEVVPETINSANADVCTQVLNDSIQTVVEARIKEINEKGTYAF